MRRNLAHNHTPNNLLQNFISGSSLLKKLTGDVLQKVRLLTRCSLVACASQRHNSRVLALLHDMLNLRPMEERKKQKHKRKVRDKEEEKDEGEEKEDHEQIMCRWKHGNAGNINTKVPNEVAHFGDLIYSTPTWGLGSIWEHLDMQFTPHATERRSIRLLKELMVFVITNSEGRLFIWRITRLEKKVLPVFVLHRLA